MLIVLRALRVKGRRANPPYFFQFFICNREAIFGSVLKVLWELSSHVAALSTLKANWFDTPTVKQCEIRINNDVLLFSAH